MGSSRRTCASRRCDNGRTLRILALLIVSVATLAAFTGALADAPPRRGVVALTTAPDGGWTQVTEPKAVYRDGVTYFCFIDGDDGHVKVGEFDHSTEAVTLTTVGTAPEVDTHDAPSLIIRPSDDRLVVWWTGHNGGNFYQRISTNALDSTAWGSATDLDSSLGGTAYTYPSGLILGSTIYLFYRDATDANATGRVAYSTSTDGGATWAAQTVLVEVSGKRAYFVVDTDGSRIDIAVTNGHPVGDSGINVYHLYLSGGNRYQADGTQITASLPLGTADLPLVYDSTVDGKAWPSSILSGSTPTFTYEVFVSGENSYRMARYDAGWTLTTIAGSGSTLEGASGHATLDDTDPDVVYASVHDGTTWTLRRYVVGGSWTPISVSGDIYPARIHDAPADRRVLWLRGTYTTYLDNSLAVMAGR